MDFSLFKDLQSRMENLPCKLNFKIGEVSSILGVKSHTLRYWEEEFSLLNPRKFHNGQRIYFKKDMELLFLIKHLLYKKKYSIKGVRENLSQYYKEIKTHSLPKQNQWQTESIADKLNSILEKISTTKELLNQKNF